MDRRTIKIEIPLPRLPKSSIFRFSLKTLAFGVTVVAIAFASYKLASDQEKSRHTGGTIHFVVSAPYEMISGSVRRNEHPDLPALVLTAARRLFPGEADPSAAEMWPPTVWIKRADWDAPELEKRINVECGGTFTEPLFGTDLILTAGDRVFVNFGQPRPTTEVVSSQQPILEPVPSKVRPTAKYQQEPK